MNDNQNTLRKAAILIASLDRESADAMISKLSPRQAAAVRRAVVELNEIDPDEQGDVMTQFVQSRPVATAPQMSGIELDDRLAARIHPLNSSDSNRPQADLETPSLETPGLETPGLETRAQGDSKNALNDRRSKNEQPFQFLHETQNDQFSGMLSKEHPQVIAVVLAHLPPERAADLLATFSSPLQVDVVQRLVHLEQTNPEVLQDIEQEIESWFHGKIGGIGQRFAGFTAASTIVRASSTQIQNQLLANLSQHDAALAQRLKDANLPKTQPKLQAKVRPYRFEEIESFDTARLVRVLAEASAEVTVLALAGASIHLVERALKQLDAAASRSIRRQMDRLGPTSLRDIEAAQNELARIATSLFRIPDEHDADPTISTTHESPSRLSISV